jgi:hypothetical protein
MICASMTQDSLKRQHRVESKERLISRERNQLLRSTSYSSPVNPALNSRDRSSETKGAGRSGLLLKRRENGRAFMECLPINERRC